jgi:DNA polymerase-3 subunit delta
VTEVKEIISESVFRKQIRDARGAYLFFGEEDYLKQNALRVAIESYIGDGARDFDLVRMDALTFSPEALASALASPPLMSERKLVVLSLSPSQLRSAELSSLLEIAEALSDDEENILILNTPSGSIDAGTPKRPSALLKRLCEAMTGVRFDRITPARLSGWCARHYSENSVRASERVCALTVDYCGCDMFSLSSEIDKISFYVLAHGRNEVTEADVKIAASPSEEFDTFALANAILAKNTDRALSVLSQMKANKTEPVIIMSELVRVICDIETVATLTSAGMNPGDISAATGIKPYPLTRYLTAIKTLRPEAIAAAVSASKYADAAVKSFGRGYVPIEQLICSI